MKTPEEPAAAAQEGTDRKGFTRHTRTPAFVSLSQLISRFDDPTFSPLGSQSLAVVLDAAELLRRIEEEAESLLAEVESDMAPKVVVFGKQEALQEICGCLSNMIYQLRGQAPHAWTVSELTMNVAAWEERFPKFLEEAERAESQHRAAIELLNSLDQINHLMLSPSMAPFRKHWQEREGIVRGAASTGDPAKAAELLLPFAQPWSTAAPPLASMARHYGLAEPSEVIDGVCSATGLANQLHVVVSWLEGSALPELAQSRQPAQLPDIPAPTDWLISPVAELTMFLELQLASSRAITMHPSRIIQGLSDMASSCGSQPSAWITDKEMQSIGVLLERSLSERLSCSLLVAAHRLVGERRELVISPIIARTARNQLWRLPSETDVAPCLLSEKHFIRTALLSAKNEIPLATRLHVEVHGEEFASADPARLESFAELRDLGSFGAWLFTAYIDRLGLPLDDVLLRRYFSDPVSGVLRPDWAYPLALLGNARVANPSLNVLLAALELLYPATANLPYRAAWSAVADRGVDFPQLRNRLERLATYGAGSADLLTSGRGTEPDRLAEAERLAREHLRPLRYRNRRSLARVSAEFQREVAEPLLTAARTVEEPSECQTIMQRIERELAALDEGSLDRKLESYSHVDQAEGAKLAEHCRRMLDTIAQYLRLKKEFFSTPGFVTSRKALDDELDQISTWGWIAQEASRLLRARLLDHQPVLLASAFPGDTTGLQPDAWLFPRCLNLWRQSDLNLANYCEALETDLRGPDPAHYAISRASQCDVEWGREVLNHVRDTTQELLEQFEQEKSVWLELIEQARSALEEEIHMRGLTLTEHERELWTASQDAIRQEAFLEAEEAIEELKKAFAEPKRTSHQRVLAINKVRDETEAFLAEISAATGRFKQRSAWFDALSKIVDFSRLLPQESALAETVTDQEVATIQADWANLRVQISAQLLELEPPAIQTETPCKTPVLSHEEAGSIADTHASQRVASESAGRFFFGVVKKLAADRTRGFITAFNPELLDRVGDIYFEQSWYIGNPDELCLGSLVEITNVSRAPGREQLQARQVNLVSEGRRNEARRQLEALVPDFDESIGIVVKSGLERKILNEFLGCLPRTADSPALDAGTIVRFEIISGEGGGPLARVTGTVESAKLSEVRKELLRKIGSSPGMARSVVQPSSPQFIGNAFQPRWLRELDPFRGDAVRVIRTLRSKVAEFDWHREIVKSVHQLTVEQAPHATWLQAVFVDSFVRVARLDRQSPREVLTELTHRVPQWWLGNMDATAADLHAALSTLVEPPSLETAKSAADILSWDDLYEFFSAVQRSLGNSPHFRVELILARLLRAQLEFSSDSDLLRRALQHVERSQVLNPRQTEALDLRRALETDLEEREPSSYKPQTGPSTRDWDSLPPDPVDVIKHIQDYYKRPDLSLALAERQFETWWKGTGGTALEELILLHARLQVNWGVPQMAHELLMRHALGSSVADWQRTLTALFDAWKGMRLTLDRIREQTLVLEKRVPKDEQPRLYLLLAKTAEDQGRLDEAIRYADLARGGLSVAAEAELVLHRLGRADLPETDPVRLREIVWNQICAAIGEGASRVDQLIAPHLNNVDVGPHLVKRVVLERQAFDLQPSGRAELCRRLIERATDPGSVDIFLANTEVQAESFAGLTSENLLVGACRRIESLLARNALQDLLVQSPTAETLAAIAERFVPGDEWRALAFFQSLAKVQPDNAAALYSLGLAAKRAAAASQTTSKGRRTAQQIFFECSLRSLGCLPEITTLLLAKQFSDAEWHGFALAVASMSPTSFGEELPISRLMDNARPNPVEWPSLMCQARVDQDSDWVGAANSAICALLGAPDYWACCQTFLDVFRQSGQHKEFARQCLELSLSLVDHLLAHRPTPELVVLKAQLLEELVGLDPRRKWEDVRHEVADLCRQAHSMVGGKFDPAAQIQERLEKEESDRPEYPAGMRILGRYDIIRPVGRGSFGQLYKAKLVEDGRVIALKQLNQSSVPSELEERRRMLREEAEFLRHQTDPHVPQFIGYSDEPPMLAMEWLDGDTVFSLRQRKLTYPDWRTVAVLARQLVGALRAAYEVASQLHPGYDFAHRDIHAANVMIVKPKDSVAAPQAKLLDFGLARLPKSLMTSEAKKIASNDMPYRDPDWPSGGLHGDMFSLGVVLYDLLGAPHPYDELKYRDYRLQRVDSRDPKELERHLRALPKECAPLAPILERMVKPAAKDRYQDWDELLRALNQLGLPA